MQASDIMTKNVATCSRDDTLSKVLSIMRTRKIHQLPVIEKKQIAGMITLDAIIKRETDPSTTKVDALMASCPSVKPETSIEDAAELILNSNVRALPVYDGELQGIVSETDIVKFVKAGHPLPDAMQDAVYVDEGDNVGKVREIMRRENVSRVPVVKQGKCTGIVCSLDLIPLLEPGKERFGGRAAFRGRDRGYKEPVNLNQTSVKAFMREPCLVKPDTQIKEILSLLREHDEVVVQNGMLGIVTPKDILRMLVKPKKLAYLQITGLKDESPLDVYKIHQAASETIRRISHVTEIQPMKITVERIQHGGKTQYSVHVQLPTQLGTFISTKAKGWELVTATQESMNNLEREFCKKHDKVRQHERSKKSKELQKMR
ncbi:MAG: CBS domain-containing protein [Candidatus Aenigmarchaeota archaeon]|nr:CBS domain-containing protein [Candidatus Aenigmarchaeota archaeon]